MSWLYSIVFAGLMFSSDGNLPVSQNVNYTNPEVAVVVPTDEIERFSQNYPLSANGRVSVSNVNGSIAIEAWDRNEVRLEYVKTADTKENLAEVAVRIEARPDSFSVETDYDDWKRRLPSENRGYNKLQVEYRLIVPRNAVLNDIETVNGSVTIANAGNMTKASAVNGEVRATNLRGTANLTTVNGMVIANFDQLQSASRISLNTVNGTVDLTIPSDANATIKADTVNGNISNDFGLPVRKGQYVGRDLYGKVGSGEVQIRLNSVNGGLSIKRKNDGKKINPAVDLLNMKSGDDIDWDDDSDESSRVKPPKPPKAPKTPKPPVIDNEMINKSISESLKESLKELDRVRPELDAIHSEEIQKQIREATANINSEKMQAQIKEAQEKYKESMIRMRDGYLIVGSPAIERKSGTFGVKGTPKVTIDAKKCAVSVRGWDKSEVSYSLVKISRQTQQTTEKSSMITVKNSDSVVDIKVAPDAKLPDGGLFDDQTKMRIEVYVPKTSNLKIITDGEIRLEGVSGDIDLQGVDEAINVRDSDGKLRVATADGRIRVIGFRGAFDGRTEDGMMNLEGDFQSFKALASDGTIVLTLPDDVNAILESNTEIENDGMTALTRPDAKAKMWRLGKGGKTYRMNVGEGKVIVRSAGNLIME